MATSRATPIVKPTCRIVLSEPEPTPRTCGGSEAMEAAERVGIARPMPMPMKATRHITSQSVVPPPSCASSARPTAKNAAPAAAGKRGPIRSFSRPALGATSSASTGITVMATAARSSE